MKEEVKKGILDNDRVITVENVQKMGEIIALTSVKTVIIRAGKNLHVLYKGLLRDLHRTENDLSHYSNGYDIAQETILFLCKHIGERLDGTCYTKTGKPTTIKQAAFSVADRYLAKQYTRHADNTISIDERITADREEILSNTQKNDYTTVDRIISKMNLTAVEYETLNAYMAGLTYCEIARIMSVNRTTIWRRHNSIQRKYLAIRQ